MPQLRKVADSQAAPTWTGHFFSLIRVFISLSFSLDAKIITVGPIPHGLMLWVTSGWKRELDLSSSGHFTYSDVLLFVAAEAGCLDGFCAFKIVTIYLGAFMDLVLKETNLEGPQLILRCTFTIKRGLLAPLWRKRVEYAPEIRNLKSPKYYKKRLGGI